MPNLDFSLDLTRGQTSAVAANAAQVSTGSDGLRIVSGLKPATGFGYSAFANDAYTNGIIKAIEGYAPQTMTTAQFAPIHLVAGEKLVLDYDYLPGDRAHNDFAFALLANSAGFITPLLLGDVNEWIGNGHRTHHAGYSFNINTTGDYKLLLASADAGDTKAPSALVVHSIKIQVPAGQYKLLPTGVKLNDSSLLRPDGALALLNGTMYSNLLSAGSASAVASLAYAIVNKPGLISQDGGGLISQDGGGFRLADGSKLISQDGGGLISQDGGGLISQDGGGLVASGGGNLVFGQADLAALAKQGADFNLRQGSSLISQDGGGFATRQFQAVPPPPPAPPQIAAAAGPEVLVSAAAGTEALMSPGATDTMQRITPVIAGLATGKSVVAWVDDSPDAGGRFEIRGQLLNADGTKSGPVIPISLVDGFDQTSPTVTGLSGGRFFVAWTDRHNETDRNGNFTRSTDIRGRFFDQFGAPDGDAVFLNAARVGPQDQPVVASLGSGGLVAFWRTNDSLNGPRKLTGQRIGADNALVGGNFDVPAPLASYDAADPAAAGLHDGGFVVAFAARAGLVSGSTPDIFAQFYAADGSAGRAVTVNTGTAGTQDKASVTVLLDGSVAIAWVDESLVTADQPFAVVRARVFDATGTALTEDYSVGFTPGTPAAPSLTALADGRFVIAWESGGLGGFSGKTIVNRNVRAQVFNPDGSLSGDEFEGETPAAGTSIYHPAATQLANGALLIASEHKSGTPSDVRAQTFTFPGESLGRSSLMGHATHGYIQGATIFADANGDGLLTTGEVSATTDAQGRYILGSTATGPLVLIGGTDTSTNLPFTGRLTAAAGAPAINALTTLVQTLLTTTGATIGQATAMVNAALGLPGDTELGMLDPVSGVLNVNGTANQALIANAVLFETMALAQAAGAPGDLFIRIATGIAAQPFQAFDPTSPAAMQSYGLTGQVATDTAALASASRDLLTAKLGADGASPAGLLADVAAVDTVVEGRAAPALAAAAATGDSRSVAGTYTGANLAAIVGAQADTAAGNPPKFSYTDVITNSVGYAQGTAYTGPVTYLQQEYLWNSTDSVAIAAAVPNAFLHGGAGADALFAKGGQNVLDGGGGSNFLIGGDGGDGGTDTFFVDGRGAVETWSTIVNFHQGDAATIFGFHPGLSTLPFTASDGAAGYTGLTIHSELNGEGTGILGSMTFTGLTQATADAHFSITQDTLLKDTPDAIDYLLIQWNR